MVAPNLPVAAYSETSFQTELGNCHNPFCVLLRGSNVALIAAVILGLSQRLLGQRRALWPTLAGIVCYALLVGGDAAVLRAACMGSLYVVATTLGRRSTALVSLAAACWLMTLINPLTLWDVGFQLSSGATAGLILFSTGVTEIFGKLWPGIKVGPSTGPVQLSAASLMDAAKRVCGGLVQDGLFVTIAANISTLPLVVYYFGRLSLVSLITDQFTMLCLFSWGIKRSEQSAAHRLHRPGP